MHRTDYFDTDAKFLRTFGSGTPVVRRVMRRDDYTSINDDNVAKANRAREIYQAEHPLKPGQPPPVYDFASMNIPFEDVEPLLIKGSYVLSIQGTGPTVIAALIKAAKDKKQEQGVYIVLQNSTKQLLFVAATPVRSTDTEITFSLLPDKDLRFVPGDRTMQVIGTLHTHFATPPPPQRDSGGTTYYSIHPGVSDKDVNSAKKDKIVVYAIDASNVHKALPNGQALNKLPLSLDIINDALDTYGKA